MGKLKFKIEKINVKDNLFKLKMTIDGKNVLEWKEDNIIKTTQWDLSVLIDYLVNDTIEFVNIDDDFPFICSGNNLCEIIKNNYEYDKFENEDQEIAYLENLNDYSYRHSWQHTSNGAILANMYFRKVGDNMEISWDNSEEELDFVYKKGCVKIPKDDYIEEVLLLKKTYDKDIK